MTRHVLARRPGECESHLWDRREASSYCGLVAVELRIPRSGRTCRACLAVYGLRGKVVVPEETACAGAGAG